MYQQPNTCVHLELYVSTPSTRVMLAPQRGFDIASSFSQVADMCFCRWEPLRFIERWLIGIHIPCIKSHAYLSYVKGKTYTYIRSTTTTIIRPLTWKITGQYYFRLEPITTLYFVDLSKVESTIPRRWHYQDISLICVKYSHCICSTNTTIIRPLTWEIGQHYCRLKPILRTTMTI